jgi:hypothetical protein
MSRKLIFTLVACISGSNTVSAFLPTAKNVASSRGRFFHSDANAHSPISKGALEGRFSTSSSKSRKTMLWNGMWSQDEEITGSDRFKACVPYILPLLDGEEFGKYIYERVPIPLGFLDGLFIGPLYEFFSGIPLLGLVIFLLLTLGTRGNTDMSRGVRFSAQQAALIDVSLVFPELIGSAFTDEDIPRYLVEPCMNFVWYTYMSMVMYCIYQNLRGKKPDQIPWISGFAELMVGPF